MTLPHVAPHVAPAPPSMRRKMTRQQKAAVIVRALLAQDTDPGVKALPDHMQERLAREMAEMRYVTKDALRLIILEFTQELESVGIHFPPGLGGALKVLGRHLSPATADILRDESGAEIQGNPWERLASLDVAKLRPIVEQESVEVCAIMLSKLSVPKAAELLSDIPSERAHQIAYAVSLTGEIDPETVARIGLALGRQLDAQPGDAFRQAPTERVGAILNASTSRTRDAVLDGISINDAAFADAVRKAIFTFANIKDRVDARDIPKLARAVDGATLLTALAHGLAETPEVSEYILENMSQRLAQQLRDEINDLGPIKPKDGEAAQTTLITALRKMEEEGELMLLSDE